ncbi:MAG: JAB domain-containing protein [Cytophagales bacterium]|nr:JAB domain-containing protein [Cytophagales bacterium]
MSPSDQGSQVDVENTMARLLSPELPDFSLARRFLQSAGYSLQALATHREEDLSRVRGATQHQARTLSSALALLPFLRREAVALRGRRISFSFEAYHLIKSRLSGLMHEEAWIILLDAAQQVLACKPVGMGGVDQVLIDPKVVFQMALRQDACTQIIVIHNHPSQDAEPSRADIRLTRQLKQASKYLSLKLLDHLIYTEKEYYSFADANRL